MSDQKENMLNENAKAWVDALRSGEFVQTAQRLHDDVGYCCLGVACELHRRAEGGEWVLHETSDFVGDTYRYLDEDGALPREVQDWLNLRTPRGQLGDWSLALLNDMGNGFDAIATLIESETEKLFRAN